MSIRKASRKFKIPRSTLFAYKQDKNRPLSYQSPKNKLLTSTEEKSLANYLRWMAKRMFPLIRSTFRAMVQEILSKRNVKIDTAVTPCKKWCQNFMKRHKLSSKKAKQMTKGRKDAASKDVIESYFDLLEKTMADLNISDSPDCLYNMDETGFSKQTDIQAPVIVPTGHRPGFTQQVFSNDHVTSVHAISASGNFLPPMIIFSKNVPKDLVGNEIKGWKYSFTKSGFISSQLFIQWFTDIFLKNIPPQRPVLLLFDPHSTHVSLDFIEIAKSNQVEVLCFPSKMSHIAQPLDQIFGYMKEVFAQTALSLKLVRSDVITNKSKFPYILQQSTDKAWSVYLVKKAFERTGKSISNFYKIKKTMS